ncbi:MAG TPA: DEAD/DEAH box helicase, partial [Candidatus Bathyarchaeia archaeon]|nr:DEAD/DEAH box helicase [Candidatus Bathyarchaeia archaeon]
MQQEFSLLSTMIQETLAETGITHPTAPQRAAIPQILSGRNILLIAPTGSGKTEAVLLPIFDQLMKMTDRHGISIIYITPLRALNRDMLSRLN